MGVVIKQATYSGSRRSDDPNMPTSGKPQPLLDTSARKPNPNIHWGSQPTGNREKDESPDVPDCASPHPEGSTDFINPEATGHDATPSDIFKGGTGNG